MFVKNLRHLISRLSFTGLRKNRVFKKAEFLREFELGQKGYYLKWRVQRLRGLVNLKRGQ